MMRQLIVGMGVAGIAAAEAIRASDPTAEITMISDDPHSYYTRPGLAYFLTGELPERQLHIKNKDDWHRLHIRYIHDRAIRLLPQEHLLETSNSGSLPYDRILLATGAHAQRLKIPGADLHGVVYLDNLEDTRRVLHLAKHTSTAVVVGGGITALELAEGLTRRRVNVHYFLRGDRYWSSVLDEDESRVVEDRLVQDGIRIHHHSELSEVLGRKGKVIGILDRNGEPLKCQMVAAAIGTQPRIGLAQQAGLATQRGILVDQYLKTNLADIFAAGDCAQVFDPLTGQAILETLWGPAREQGHAAGMNMAGVQTAYRRAAALNVTRLAGMTVTLIGAIGGGKDPDLISIARGDSESWRFGQSGITLYQCGEINRLRLIVGEKHLTGALVMGDQTLSRPLQELIAFQADITPIRTELMDPQAPIDEILINFWRASVKN